MTYKLAAHTVKGLPLLGNAPNFRRDPIAFLEHCAACGDVVPIKLMKVRGFQINHPDLIEQVLVQTGRAFAKSPPGVRHGRDAAQMMFGNGLLTSDGEFWLRQRRLAQPAFHRDRIAAYGEIMVDHTERALSTWQGGETRDIHRDMMAITLDIVAKTLFDAEVDSEVAMISHAMDVIMERVQHDQVSPQAPVWLPTPGNRRFNRVMAELDKLIYRFIAERRTSGADPGDLLAMLLAAQDDQGQGMSDKQLRDELMTFFLAGHETTALSLSWTWFLLSRHPDVRERLEAELDTVLAGRSPTMADLPSLTYTEQVLKESMRLYPPAWGLNRFAVQDVELGGARIPRGSFIFASQWTMHRDARFFPEPLSFLPERWTESFTKQLPRYAYFPFGGGARLCIGMAFAQMEGALLLADIAQRFRLTLVPGHPVEPQPSITIRPKHGLRMTVAAR
jgi:cytochrome P450